MEPISCGQEQRPSSENHGGKENGLSTTSKSRKKVDGGIRAWFHLTDAGLARSMDIGKQGIKRRTGLSARDLRILDPILAYPLVILARRRAVVVNLEHIKGVITAKDVWLLNAKDPAMAPYVESLKHLVIASNQDVSLAIPSQKEKNTELSEEDEDEIVEVAAKDYQERLPFEFMVLGACLENVCSSLDIEVETLEQESYPTLDELKLNITNFTFGCLRQIKSRLLLLNNRVQKMKEELEHLLGDDNHMAEICLTDKLRLQEHGDNRSSAKADGDGDESNASDDRIDEVAPADSASQSRNPLTKEIQRVKVSNHVDGGNKHHRSPELEKLLEDYLVRIDSTFNKVSKLKEHVHNMEDYLRLMLDDKQNSLLQTTILVRTATVVLTVYIVFTGVMAMNIQIPLWQQDVVSNKNILLANGAATAFTIVRYLLLVGLYKYKSWLI
ncbi:hypothetical protein MLD38_013438 [Melastoma candidum]|uniref:Uncharacterized protein n=1 Tax=Melastoma candidum TaxID=119954 RepID=A0ACB9R9P2_9MYRT|nr:hypothetical protein MLD38_013438 [Melastoma candidum]